MQAECNNLAWWQKGIIYQVYLKSFKDTNGDGIGDLRGVLEKIDYFKRIGVDIIYLNPFYPHGGSDNGYDVISYCDIDPTYGTMADFDELIEKIHNNGMYLIIDFIPNHTSNQHEWFQKSCESDSPDNPYRDYYVWYPSHDSINPPNNWLPVAGDCAWTYNKNRKAWYYHAFLPEQPDLNFRCPAIKIELENILKFWLSEKNVDGIRIDAIRHLYEDDLFMDEPQGEIDHEKANALYESYEHIYTMYHPGNYEILAEWRQLLDKVSVKTNTSRVLFVETYEKPDSLKDYFSYQGTPAAHFPLNTQFINLCETKRLCVANIKEFKPFKPSSIKSLIDEWTKFKDTPLFWTNWMIGSQDCARVATRIGQENVKLANALCLLIGGTPFTYYGEEIGMEDLDYDSISFEECQDNFGKSFGRQNYKKYNRDYCRSPMQWNDSVNAGFTDPDSKPWMKFHPNYKNINVKDQLDDANSVLMIYHEIVRIRKFPAFLYGDFEYAIINEDIFSFTRKAYGYPPVLVIMNLSQQTKTNNFLMEDSVPLIVEIVFYFDNIRCSKDGYYKSQEKICTKSISLNPKSCLIVTWNNSNLNE